MKTGNQKLVKEINQSIVLKTIQQKGPLSRSELASLTGLNKATISTIVNNYIKSGMIYDIGIGHSNRGRKPVMLLLNKNAGFSIGIDLGVDYILGVLTDLDGNVIEEFNVEFTNKNPDYVISLIKSSIQQLILKAPESKYGIVGIGIGVPGVIDTDNKILLAPNLNWRDVDILKEIEKSFNLPVLVDNEANAGAYGEKKYGSGKNISNLIYISAGIGIGVGIILNNVLFKGKHGISGEVGHLSIHFNGKKCTCGNVGCWELYASENALLKQAKNLSTFHNLQQQIDIETVRVNASKGDKEVINLCNNIGKYMGVGIVNLINTFDVEQIIIGNRLASLKDWISNPIQRIIDQRLLLKHSRNSLKLNYSELNNYSCALGASSFAISNFLFQDDLSFH